MTLNPFAKSTGTPPTPPRPASGPFPAVPDADTLKANASTSHTDPAPVTIAQGAAVSSPDHQTPIWPTEDQAAALHPVLTQDQLDADHTAANQDGMEVTTDRRRQGEPGVIYTEPEAEKDTPTPPAPRRDGRSTTKHRRRLSQAEARKVRERYAYRRELADAMESAEDWESVADTEAGLAKDFGATRPAIRNIVLGSTYPNAGGPIDHHRRARRDQYETEKETYGREVALSKYMSYRPGDTDFLPARIGVVVREPGKEPREYTYPAGTHVEVTSAQGSDQDPETEQ